jgi:hypothetical protein
MMVLGLTVSEIILMDGGNALIQRVTSLINAMIIRLGSRLNGSLL